MGKLSAKLHSTRGASLVIALVFLLVCLLLGVVCLGAAAANAGRHTHLHEDQASYLAVRSAAELLRDDIGGVEYGITQTTVGSGDPRIEYEPETDVSYEDKLYFHALLDALVRAACEREPNESEQAATLEIAFGDSRVTAKLKMYNHARENGYSISAELYIAGEAAPPGESGPKESYMRLYIPASVTKRRDVNSTSNTTVETTTIVWGEGSITKALEAGSGVTP